MNSEQVSFKSFAKTGERLCDPDIGRELVPPLWSRERQTEKSCDFTDRPLFSLRDGGTRRPAEVVEQNDRAGVCALTNVWR